MGGRNCMEKHCSKNVLMHADNAAAAVVGMFGMQESECSKDPEKAKGRWDSVAKPLPGSVERVRQDCHNLP